MTLSLTLKTGFLATSPVCDKINKTCRYKPRMIGIAPYKRDIENIFFFNNKIRHSHVINANKGMGLACNKFVERYLTTLDRPLFCMQKTIFLRFF